MRKHHRVEENANYYDRNCCHCRRLVVKDTAHIYWEREFYGENALLSLIFVGVFCSEIWDDFLWLFLLFSLYIFVLESKAIISVRTFTTLLNTISSFIQMRRDEARIFSLLLLHSLTSMEVAVELLRSTPISMKIPRKLNNEIHTKVYSKIW